LRSHDQKPELTKSYTMGNVARAMMIAERR
jgi:hypothetical protein